MYVEEVEVSQNENYATIQTKKNCIIWATSWRIYNRSIFMSHPFPHFFRKVYKYKLGDMQMQRIYYALLY